jgi:NADH-quinone oxidoreductase subunit K
VSVGLNSFLLISAGLFAIGGFGLVTRRSLAAIVMSTGLMFAAGVVALAAFARFDLVAHHQAGGQALGVVVALAAAGEVALGLSLLRLPHHPHGPLIDDLDG